MYDELEGPVTVTENDPSILHVGSWSLDGTASISMLEMAHVLVVLGGAAS